MKLILSHPTGNANLKATAKGLVEADMLYEFYTSMASFSGSIIHYLGHLGPLKELNRREFDPRLQPYTKTWPWREMGRQISSKLKWQSLVEHEKGIFSIDEVYKSIDKHVANQLPRLNKGTISSIYAYEDEALHSFQSAKHHDIKCLYDLPIGYWKAARRLLLSEKELRPEWASTLTGFRDSENKLARKDKELALADHIFVASTFTKETLKEYSGPLAPISIIPYGFPEVATLKHYTSLTNRPLKLLFVGGLSQRKGIANLFEAVDYFDKRVELTVVGNKAVPDCAPLNKALIKHRWIPSLPHHKILALMKEHDIFVFPSLFEGFGLVITEAMSQGTPVITTERTAGPDLITNDENGWLIQAGNTEALKIAIEKILSKPTMVAQVGKAALHTAKQRPWSAYGHELTNSIKSIIK
ncbi:glycosyltransferase family 4 protein [Tellurirhabdus bombi]|uniref:glycosyltransferase family 4 protein n=1 Tax=Tellurirhabdus bombi TaxID=2907205 RepID=UPI001F2810B9|nr:glycosyltransferase family 4 protein [Tellurirhabdus bombi]